MVNLNDLKDHILYKIFKFIFSISSKTGIMEKLHWNGIDWAETFNL